MAKSTKNTNKKSTTGKLKPVVRVENSINVSELDYSERAGYIEENYAPFITDAQMIFSIWDSGIEYDYKADRKEVVDSIIEKYIALGDYTEATLPQETIYEIQDWTLVRKDIDPETDEVIGETELKQITSDNTYNFSYNGLVDLNWRVYHDEEFERYFYVITPHLGGDIRGNYGDAIILEGNNKDELFYRFYEGFVSGGASIYFKFKDGSEIGFDSEQDSDVFNFRVSESFEPTGMAKKYLNDFEKFDSWKGDEFLEETIDIYLVRKGVAPKMMAGGSLNDETPMAYIQVLGYDEGKWFNITDYSDGQDVIDGIADWMNDLNEEFGGNREEYEVTDYEGFGKDLYDEYMGANEFGEIIEAYEKYEDSDFPADVITEFKNDSGRKDDTLTEIIERMDDNYLGKYDNLNDFGYEMVNQGVYTPSDNDVFITDTDKRILAGEEADAIVDDMRFDDLLNIAVDVKSEYEDEKSELEDKISELESEIEDLTALQESSDDDEYETISEQIEEKEIELQEVQSDLDGIDSRFEDKAREEARDLFYDEIKDRLENDLSSWLSEHGYEDDLQNINFLSVDYEKIGEEISADYLIIEYDGSLYFFNNYEKGGRLMASKRKPKYDFYIVESSTKKLVSGYSSKEESLEQRKLLVKEYPSLRFEIYTLGNLEAKTDLDVYAKKDYVQLSTLDKIKKVSVDAYRYGEEKVEQANQFLKKHDVKGRINRGVRSAWDKTKQGGNWIKRQWDEADFGDGKGKAKYFADGGDVSSRLINNFLVVNIDGKKYKTWFPYWRSINKEFLNELNEKNESLIIVEGDNGDKQFRVTDRGLMDIWLNDKSAKKPRKILIEKAIEFHNSKNKFADGGGVDDFSDLYGQEVMALKNAKIQAKRTGYDYVVYSNTKGEISFARKNEFERFFDKDESKILYTINEKGNSIKIQSKEKFADGDGVDGDNADLSNTEKSEIYTYLDENNWTIESFMERYNKTEEQSWDIIDAWAGSRGIKGLSFADGGEADSLFEIVVVAKGLEKDGGQITKDRFSINSISENEAKNIARKMWEEEMGNSDFHIIDVLTDAEYRNKYLSDKYEGGGTTSDYIFEGEVVLNGQRKPVYKKGSEYYIKNYNPSKYTFLANEEDIKNYEIFPQYYSEGGSVGGINSDLNKYKNVDIRFKLIPNDGSEQDGDENDLILNYIGEIYTGGLDSDKPYVELGFQVSDEQDETGNINLKSDLNKYQEVDILFKLTPNDGSEEDSDENDLILNYIGEIYTGGLDSDKPYVELGFQVTYKYDNGGEIKSLWKIPVEKGTGKLIEKPILLKKGTSNQIRKWFIKNKEKISDGWSGVQEWDENVTIEEIEKYNLQEQKNNNNRFANGGGVDYPTKLKIGSVIQGVGFTMLKGLEGGKFYKIVDKDGYSATLVESDENGKIKKTKKLVRHYLDSLEGGISTVEKGDNNGFLVIKYADGGTIEEEVWLVIVDGIVVDSKETEKEAIESSDKFKEEGHFPIVRKYGEYADGGETIQYIPVQAVPVQQVQAVPQQNVQYVPVQAVPQVQQQPVNPQIGNLDINSALQFVKQNPQVLAFLRNGGSVQDEVVYLDGRINNLEELVVTMNEEDKPEMYATINKLKKEKEKLQNKSSNTEEVEEKKSFFSFFEQGGEIALPKDNSRVHFIDDQNREYDGRFIKDENMFYIGFEDRGDFRYSFEIISWRYLDGGNDDDIHENHEASETTEEKKAEHKNDDAHENHEASETTEEKKAEHKNDDAHENHEASETAEEEKAEHQYDVYDNKRMLENQANEIEHHSEELTEQVKSTEKVPAWVIAKMERATTDLSDITHYLDGENKMADGGKVGEIRYDIVPHKNKFAVIKITYKQHEDYTYPSKEFIYGFNGVILDFDDIKSAESFISKIQEKHPYGVPKANAGMFLIASELLKQKQSQQPQIVYYIPRTVEKTEDVSTEIVQNIPEMANGGILDNTELNDFCITNLIELANEIQPVRYFLTDRFKETDVKSKTYKGKLVIVFKEPASVSVINAINNFIERAEDCHNVLEQSVNVSGSEPRSVSINILSDKFSDREYNNGGKVYDYPPKKISIEKTKKIKTHLGDYNLGLITNDFVYFVNSNEEDENAQTIMYNKNGELLSDNIHATNDLFQVLETQDNFEFIHPEMEVYRKEKLNKN